MDRQLKVTIKTEIKRGFADLSRQMGDLARAMKSIESLQGSINRLADQFDRNNKIREAAKNTKALADNTKQYAGALRQVGQNPYEKLLRSVQELNAAQKAGAISAQQRAQAEVRALDQYIKKTNDLSIAQKKLRDTSGKFISLSPEGRSFVNGQRPIYSSPAGPYNPYIYGSRIGPTRPPTGVNPYLYNYGAGPFPRRVGRYLYNDAIGPSRPRAVNPYLYSNKMVGPFNPGRRILYSSPVGPQPYNPVNEKLYNSPAGPSTATFEKFQNEQQKFSSLIERAYAENEKRSAAWSKLINKAYEENEKIDAKFSAMLIKAYGENEKRDAQLAKRSASGLRPSGAGYTGGSGGGASGGGGFSGRAAGANAEGGAIAKLTETYNKFGRVLFQLQYSTLTLFSLSGIGLIMKTVDATTSLKNQLAYSAQNADQLKTNIDQVYKIANETFAPASAVAGVFSTIDKYRESSHLSSDQVATITKGISGAFAASPGTSEEHAQAQYQFIQSIRSNRFGGDELRAVLEEAPGVGDILAREVGRLRGKKGPIDLRDSKNPVTREEIFKVFGDPRVVKEIYDTLALRTRSFGDVLTIAKNRFDELISKFETGNGLFGSLNNTLAKFLTNDVALNKFTKAVEQAAIAAATYALGVGALGLGKAGVSGAVGVVNGIRNANAGAGAYILASQRATAVRGVEAAFAGTPYTTLGSAGVAAAEGEAAAAMANMSKGMQLIAKTGIQSAAAITILGGALNFLMTGGVGLLIGGIALLTARFSEFLKQSGTGVTVIDVITVGFKKLWDMMNDSGNAIGVFTKPIIDLIDKLAKRAADAANNDPSIRSTAFHNRYGAHIYANGKEYDYRLVGGRQELDKAAMAAELAIPGVDVARQAPIYHTVGQRLGLVPVGNAPIDPKTKKPIQSNGRIVTGLGSGLALKNPDAIDLGGGKFFIPSTVDHLPVAQNKNYGTSEKPEDALTKRIAEFWRDLGLQVEESTKLVGVPEAFQEIKKHAADNLRRYADILNIPIEDIPKKVKDKIDAANRIIEENDIQKAVTKFFKDIDKQLRTDRAKADMAGMRSGDAELFQRKQDMLSKFANSPAMKENLSQYTLDNINGFIDRGQLGIGQAMLEAHAPKATVDKLRSSLATDEQSYYDRQHNTVTSSLELQKKQLELNDQINASYGRRRELVQAQTEIEMRYFAQNKNLTPKQIADMAAEMQMAKQQFDQQTKYMANWKNGVGEAAGDYLDEIQNTAKSTHQIFSNAFKGIEDMFVEFMETGKLNWKSFLQQLAADFLRMEFQKMIMAPFVNGFNAVINPSAAQPNVGGMPGMAGLGGLIGSGVKGIAGMLGLGGSSAGMGILGPTYSIAASTPTIGALSDVLPALAFHTGGVVGSTGAITHNLPSSVFAGAVRYHTGGIAGLAPDEVPAVLRKGERVLTSAQQHAMKSGNASLHFNPQIEINYQAGDGSSSKVDAANMGNQINDAIEAKWKDMMIRESRPGGRLYGAVR